MPRVVGVRTVGLSLALALPALAQQAPPKAPELGRLVADLDSQDPWVRLDATVELASGRLPLREVEQALTRTDLSDEQRQRLMSVAASLFQEEPRAAMGISFTRVQGDNGTYVVSTVPGFDAGTLLREDDRMDAIDGERLRSAAHAVALIQSHDPGDVVEVEAFRNGQVIRVKLRLGSRNDLQEGGASDLSELAWQIRSREYASAGEPVVIECPVGAEAWAPPPRDERSRRMNPGARVVVSAGGEARTAPHVDLTTPRIGGPRLVINAPAQPAARGDRDLLDFLQKQREEIARQFKNILEREKNPNLNERRRRELEFVRDQAAQELARLDELIRQVTARIGAR